MKNDAIVPDPDLTFVQIIGTQRSGSNLLREMISQLDHVFAPHPPHILDMFFPLLPGYGDIGNEDKFHRLVSDICEYVKLNPVPWKDAELDPGVIARVCRTHELLEIFLRIYEMNALKKNARYWFCKSMQNVKYIKLFEERGIKPYFMHLIRDGRDVALSFKKTVVGEKHIYHLAKQWKQDQDLSMEYTKHLDPSRTIRIRYEDLLSSPENEIRRVCNLIGMKYSNNILKFYQSEDSMITASSGDMWQNLTRPLIRNNFNKFKMEMSQEDLEIFEAVAGETLESFGYARELSMDMARPVSIERINAFDMENIRLKKKSREEGDPIDLEKRKGQEELIKSIKSRAGL